MKKKKTTTDNDDQGAREEQLNQLSLPLDNFLPFLPHTALCPHF